MTFCTIAEFGWDETFDHTGMTGCSDGDTALAGSPLPAPTRVSSFGVTAYSAA
ncbi:MAG: hypothetical protein ABJB47_12235 [Actinomycetota bacterium]